MAKMTLVSLASEFKVPVHRLQYLVKSRQIQPAERVGNIRLFDETALERLRAELHVDHRCKASA